MQERSLGGGGSGRSRMWGKPSLEAWGFSGGCLVGERSQVSRLPHPLIAASPCPSGTPTECPSALRLIPALGLKLRGNRYALPLCTAPPPEKKGRRGLKVAVGI